MADEKNPEEMKPKEVIGALSGEARAHLTLAFRRILRPLVRILIRAGVRYDEFCETVKGVYVESAVRDGLGPLGKGTRARIAFVTGVGRRDVDRYIDDPSLLARPRQTFARTLTEIIHLWHTDPAYQGPYGVPIELDFVRAGDRSFVTLARSVDPSFDPAQLVDELLRSRVVVNAGDRLKVVSRTYVVPEAMSAPMLEHFGNALSDLATTISNNNDATPDKRVLERSVFPDRGLPQSLVPDFEKMVRSLVQQLITDVDNWVADTMKEHVPLPKDPEVDLGITIFEYKRLEKTLPALRDLLPPDPQ